MRTEHDKGLCKHSEGREGVPASRDLLFAPFGAGDRDDTCSERLTDNVGVDLIWVVVIALWAADAWRRRALPLNVSPLLLPVAGLALIGAGSRPSPSSDRSTRVRHISSRYVCSCS